MSDILSPQLVRIGGGIYRHRRVRVSENVRSTDSYGGFNEYEDENEEWTQEEEERWSLEYLSHGRYKAKLRIPDTFYGHLIGKKGSSKKELERVLDVTVKFPKRDEEVSNIVEVHGGTKRTVMSACRRIILKVDDLRDRMPYTHFVSIPLNTPSVHEAFETFRAQALTLEESLYPDVFISPERLHLTIVVMTLLEEEEKRRATNLLKICQKKFIKAIMGGNKSLHLELKGLQIMNDDPSSANVLFMNVKSEILQQICDELVEAFVAEGITPEKQLRKVKMHMTLMNTKQIKPLTEKWNDATIDVRRILQEFQDLSFGSVEVSELHLNEMSGDSKDGYYKSVCTVSL